MNEPDLSLRLSLGGIYCEKSKEKSLTRSTSIIGMISHNDEMCKWKLHRQRCSFLSLARSCSLPTKTDQLLQIKRKELQLMRRLEAKKRLVGQRNGRAAVGMDKSPAKAIATVTPPSPAEVATSMATPAAKSPALCQPIDKIKFLPGHGSVGSTNGSSDTEQVVISQTRASTKDEPVTNRVKRARISEELMERDGVVDMMKTMPNVSTIGDGPNGRKVEGLLYKYKKGEVCIVCVCHGNFLTPAEFVKHAGGREVANPMKHIHVYYTSFS